MKRFGACCVLILSATLPATLAQAPRATPVACDEWLPAAREVKGRKVGPTSCQMAEGQLNVASRPFVRIDIGLDGSVEGYVTKSGEYRGYMTNSPELAFPQTADPGPPVLAFADYRRSQGAAMALYFPQDPAAWNGKLWVMAHGAGPGTDRAWDLRLKGEPDAAAALLATSAKQVPTRRNYSRADSR